jgi:hypothetical protein
VAAQLLLSIGATWLWGAERGREVAGVTLGFTSVVLVLIGAYESFGGEVRSGRALLWLQKPVSPVRHFLLRWSTSTALSLLLVTGLVALDWLVLAGVSPVAAQALLREAPVLLLVGTAIAALVLAVSGWGGHPDAPVAVVILFLSMPLAAAGPRLGAMEWTLDLLLFPWEETVRLGEALAGSRAADRALSDAGAVVRTTTLWILIGLAGIHVRSRHPFPAASG